jgi:hypothetical protein
MPSKSVSSWFSDQRKLGRFGGGTFRGLPPSLSGNIMEAAFLKCEARITYEELVWGVVIKGDGREEEAATQFCVGLNACSLMAR